MMTIGETIKRRREECGYNAEYVAEKIGISAAAMYRYEKDEFEPRAKVLIKLADLFGTTVDSLLGRDCAVKKDARTTVQARGVFLTQAELVRRAKQHFANGFIYALETDTDNKISDSEKELLRLFSELSIINRSKVVMYAVELKDKQQEDAQ